jgi:phosphoribosylamine--glycine ligase
VLVIGSGGREHALAWRLGLEGVDVTVAPGNGGTPRTTPVPADDVAGLVDLAHAEHFDFTVVGPEVPLAMGIVDAFEARGLKIFGPSQAAARLESSKAFSKDFFVRHGIPTARAQVVSGAAAARRAIASFGLPVVLKADGLAAGKGVWVIHDAADVEQALTGFQALGEDGLVEECLSGPELSVLAFTDGERFSLMPPARDYKRVFEFDKGPNTGGMGAFTRPSDVSDDLIAEIASTVIAPTLAGMAAEAAPYRGVLYAGLMLTSCGPRVLEFNCRFGDPECQVIVPLFRGSLSEVLESVAEGRLDTSSVTWADERTYGVVLATHGYPEDPRTGDEITNIPQTAGVEVFQAGTRRHGEKLLTSGGRVMTLVSTDRHAVYEAAAHVTFEGKHYRRDIGQEA